MTQAELFFYNEHLLILRKESLSNPKSQIQANYIQLGFILCS